MRSTSAALLLETLTGFLADEPPFSAAVGYSGGRDSGVLLWALVEALGAERVTALHIDHGWRPAEERAAERALVEDVCRRLGTALVHWGPPAMVAATEASARAYRYQWFGEFVDAHPGTLVFLGHHADDQAETILMRLLKGRSWQGLAGMPSRRGPFRRPFLGVSGAVLDQAARDLALAYHTDSTNADLSPLRNDLRRRIFPALERRFPHATKALVDFGTVWGQAALLQEPHPGWDRAGSGYRIAGSLWAGWSALERQAQLLSLVNRVEPTAHPARRFLETIAVRPSGGRVRGAGWEWSWGALSVSWGPVAPAGGKEYFIHAVPGRVYDLGTYRFSWDGGTGLPVAGIDPGRPWVWRSLVPGMLLSSVDTPAWGRDLRKKRLGSRVSDLALLIQDGLVRAVIDVGRKCVVWAESRGEKLHKPGIFVTLVTVTPISTE